MKPPVELSRPTILNIAAIFCYCLAMLFHIISFATDSWSSLKLEGVTWTVGLWHGCRHDNDTWVCTPDVFQDKVFKTGSDWHTGSQVMMTFAFVALFLLEFAIIGYSCVKRLERYKSRLVGIILALSGTAGFCHFLTVIMYGTEVQKIPESKVLGSFGIVIICLFIEVIIPILIYIDKSRRFPKDNVFIKTGGRQRKWKPGLLAKADPVKSKDSGKGIEVTLRDKDKNTDRTPYSITGGRVPVNMPSVSMRTSVSSLSEAETYKKFAYLEDSTMSIGSAHSLNTQTTGLTNHAYSTDKVSIESEL